jgi:hypothetical protein
VPVTVVAVPKNGDVITPLKPVRLAWFVRLVAFIVNTTRAGIGCEAQRGVEVPERLAVDRQKDTVAAALPIGAHSVASVPVGDTAKAPSEFPSNRPRMYWTLNLIQADEAIRQLTCDLEFDRHQVPSAHESRPPGNDERSYGSEALFTAQRLARRGKHRGGVGCLRRDVKRPSHAEHEEGYGEQPPGFTERRVRSDPSE